MRQTLLLITLGLGACLSTASGWADEFTPAQRAEIIQILRDALRQDPTILRDAVTALQADEGDRQQAASRSAIEAARATLIDPADPVGGNPKGDVTVVEFFDVRCPYCKRLAPTVAELATRDRGVRLIYKDLPILGPPSLFASKALLAAQKQNGYEKLRIALMATSDITKSTVQAAALKLGLDWPRLERDMDDPAIQTRIDANLKLARSLNITGTPALIIGKELIPGAVELGTLQKAVAEARTAR